MVGVALEGGGARGSYQIGALKALKKLGIEPTCYVGTSIGSVNAALAAMGDIKKLESIWKNVSCEELFNIDSNLLHALESRSLNRKVIREGARTVLDIVKNAGIDITNLKKLYKQYINEDVIRNSKINFGLVTYGLSDKKPIEIFLKDIPKGKLHEYLIASCYLPVFKMEKIIDDKYYLDGGFHDNCPINMLLREGYDEIYAIRTYSLGFTQKLIDNDAKITYIGPKKKLGSILLFSKESIKYNSNLGFYDTLKAVQKLDGNDYYMRRRDNSYYERITSEIENIELYMLENRTRDIKKLTINIFEKLMKEFKLEQFKVYSIPFLVLRLKKILNDDVDHKYYKFIKKIKIVF